MTTRWWAPDGPMPVDRLLTAGPDPQKDLGLALFGLHRAGAEACELVAKTAVADEHVLAAALAETRHLVAPQAVQTVSKAVGGPQYAGLLLADLLDDAEVAALALYRTCLAKSVAPPIAAQRVGMVFGVSSREMSRYASVASDPKANPRAVEDLADRTLFGFVSKVVAEEYEPVKELVSKTTPYEDRHNVRHGSGGQYVAEREEVLPGSSLQDLFDRAEARQREEATRGPQVADQMEDPRRTTGPEVARPKQMKRMSRMKRMEKPKDSQELSRQQLTRQSLGRQSLLNLRLTPQQLALQELVKPLPPALPLSGNERKVGDLLAARHASSTVGALNQPVSFVMTDAEFNSVARAAGDLKTGEHVLRIGGLEEYAGGAVVYQEGGVTTQAHQGSREHVAHMLLGSEAYRGQADLRFGAVPQHVLLATGDADAALDAAKLVFLQNLKRDHPELARINPATEVTHVDHAPDKDDPDTMILIWRPPPQDRTIATRPIPRVVEMVVTPKAVRGEVKGNRVELSGNDPVKMKSLFTRGKGGQLQSKTFWDKHLGVMVSTVFLTGGTEDEVDQAWQGKGWKGGVGKAEDYLERHHVANAVDTGRFVREGERVAPEVLPGVSLQSMLDRAEERHMAKPTATPRRMARMKRMKRMERPAEPRQELTRHALARPTLSRQQLEKHVVERQALREKTDKKQELVWFDDDTIFAPVKPEVIAAFSPRGFPEDAHLPVQLTPGMMHALNNLNHFVGQAAEINLEDNAKQAWAGQVVRDRDGNVVTNNETRIFNEEYEPDYDERWDKLHLIGQLLDDTVHGDPKASMFRLEMTPIEGTRKVHLRIFRNRYELPVQHLFRYIGDPESRPSRLVPEPSTKRMQSKFTYEHWLRTAYESVQAMNGHSVDMTIGNPRVKTWRIE